MTHAIVQLLEFLAAQEIRAVFCSITMLYVHKLGAQNQGGSIRVICVGRFQAQSSHDQTIAMCVDQRGAIRVFLLALGGE